MSDPKTIQITVSMSEQIAWELAQFIKRSTFDMYLEMTEAHLPYEERKAKAYMMIAGIEAIGGALKETGAGPR